MDALLDEPLVGQLVSAANRPQDRRGGHSDVLEPELRMTVGEGVGVVGVLGQAQSGGVVVDQEQGRQTTVAIEQMAVEQHEVRVVRARDEPLLPVEQVVARGGVTHGGGRQGPGVGTCLDLGDRVAAGPLAAQRGVQISPTLVRVTVEQGVVWRGHVGPQAARDLPKLLVDKDLLQGGPALPTEGFGHRATVQVGGNGGAPELLCLRHRHPSTVELKLGFKRLEQLADVGAGTSLEVEFGGAEGQVHDADGDGRHGRRAISSRSAQRRQRAPYVGQSPTVTARGSCGARDSLLAGGQPPNVRRRRSNSSSSISPRA